ncbi:MAG: hypothetical protein ACXVA9_07630 [Bdellovibrionales bacterium]
MKSILFLILSFSSAAFAGHSTMLLKCTGAGPTSQYTNQALEVYYNYPSSVNKAYLGFHAYANNDLKDGDLFARFYCFGGCGKIQRIESANQVAFEIGNDLKLNFSRDLVSPGATGEVNLEVDMTDYTKVIHFSGPLTCVAQPDVAKILEVVL